ncbi:MAG: hypothetical protein P8R54_08330 [Myxococcota bacterium]|nr:hypothetical protein [Myxococcota bacterium]
MHDVATDGTLERWKSGHPSPRERLHRLLLEQVTPAHLQRMLSVEELPRVKRSPAWFMWRLIMTQGLSEPLPSLIAALPHQASALEALSAVWSEEHDTHGVILLELHDPDLERLTVTGLSNLVASLSRSLEAEVVLTGVFTGRPHLRPATVVLLELSIGPAGCTRLVEDDDLLESISVGGCPLHGLHTVRELVWSRKPPSLPAVTITRVAGVLLTGVFLFSFLFVGILIPRYRLMTLKAQRSEASANVDGIQTAELAYDAAFGAFVEQPSFVPGGTAGHKGRRSWESGTGFDELGWSPDGRVRGSYKVDLLSTTPRDFRVTGVIDVDADGVPASYTATRTTSSTRLTDDSVL